MSEQFAQAIHRQSTMLLDNIGIRVSFAELPSAAEYREAKRAYYRGPWWWRRWFRPWLRPEHHRRLTREIERWHRVTQQEMLTEVMRQGEELIA